MSWFVDADDEPRHSRLVERHIRFGKDRARATAWVTEVDEPNASLIAATRARADVVVAGRAVPAPDQDHILAEGVPASSPAGELNRPG